MDSGNRRPASGFGSGRRHSDLKKHGDGIRQKAKDIVLKHRERERFLGVDPSLVLVFELGATVDPAEFRRSGLRLVDSSDGRVTIAFADDPELAAFHERLEAMQGPVPEDQKSEPFAQFFDAIDDIRLFGPDDRLTPEARAAAETGDPDERVRLDVECWHPGSHELTADAVSQLRTAVGEIEGEIASTFLNDAAGLILARVYVPASQLAALARLDVVARIDVLPIPALSTPKLFNTEASDLPEMQPPRSDAPIVGLIDSGVASAHELLAGSVIAAEPIGTGILDGQDEHGHGTMVASLLLHGDVEQAIARGVPLRPLCRIVSARVLDANNAFPEADLWEEDLAAAIEWCAKQGATIINLSLGDTRSPFSPPRQMSAAALVDELARRLNLVIVVATGNSVPAEYLPRLDSDALSAYPSSLLAHPRTGILDPGTSLLAITVGGITTALAAGGQSGSETPARQPMGAPGWPAPVSRTGPGPAMSVKPELVEQSGTLGVEDGRLVGNDAELGVIGARAEAGRLLAWDIGTSYAVPLVARIAAGVRGRFPSFSAELVRALVLLSANRLPFGDEFEGTPAIRLEAERNVVGYGRPSLRRAIESTSHRAVLVAEADLPRDGVHIYEIPLPSTFSESGGERGVDIALAFSPQTRVRRLDYAASRMEFHLVRGLSVDEIRETFARIEGEDVDDDGEERSDKETTGDVVASIDKDAADQAAEAGKPPTPSELGASLVKLTPSASVRSRGANQLGRRIFKQRLRPDDHTPMHLVVRSVNRWADPEGLEPYAIAVALWRDDDKPELHAELSAELEAVIEVEIEVEAEIEI